MSIEAMDITARGASMGTGDMAGTAVGITVTGGGIIGAEALRQVQSKRQSLPATTDHKVHGSPLVHPSSLSDHRQQAPNLAVKTADGFGIVRQVAQQIFLKQPVKQRIERRW